MTPTPLLSAPQPPFDDVILRLFRQSYFDDQPDVFQLSVRQAPGPLSGGAFQVDVEAKLVRFSKQFQTYVMLKHSTLDIPATEPDDETPVQLGQKLYALLPSDFRRDFPLLVQRAFERERGIRLVVEAKAGDQADRLLSLPWELLFFHETQAYLTRSPYAIVERRLLDVVRRASPQMQAPFSLIHIIAAPTDAPPLTPALKQVEQDTLPSAVGVGRYREVEGANTLGKLREALTERQYHILHFLGHGELQGSDASATPRAYPVRGCLLLADEQGETELLTGEQLQHWLHRTPTVQLVVLNACQGGGIAAGTVALEMVHSGFPYVVAMQGNISHAAAQQFSTVFYQALQRGYSIGYAITLSRVAIAEATPSSLDWCLPVLYTNEGVGPLPPSQTWARRFTTWLIGVGTSERMAEHATFLGVFHLFFGCLLWLSGASAPLPDRNFLTILTLLHLALVPGLLTASLTWHRPPMAAGWPRAIRAAFLGDQLFAAITVVFGAWMSYFMVAHLFLSLGLWPMLSLPARYLLFLPSLLFATLVAYYTMLSTASTFVTSHQFRPSRFDPSLFATPVLVAAFMLLLAWFIESETTQLLLSPPNGNFLFGLMALGLAWAFNRENKS